MGVSALYRDKGGEIGRKHGDTLIGTLRTSYGSRFAKGCADSDTLSEVLTKLDEQSLFKLVRDHKAGMLHIRLRTLPGGSTPPRIKVKGQEPKGAGREARGGRGLGPAECGNTGFPRPWTVEHLADCNRYRKSGGHSWLTSNR